MTDTILVAYASKYGATKEIAERIGAVMAGAGLNVDVKPVDQVRDPAPYSAVVLGSAVYMGQWRKEAAKFLKGHADALATRPVWLFASGPTEEGDPVEAMEGWVIPPGLKGTVERIAPREVTVFGGSLDMANLNFAERAIIKKVEAPTGDYRDWPSIEAWAAGVADAIRQSVPA